MLIIKKNRDFLKHLNIFKGIFNQLKKIDMKIDKEDKGVVIWYCIGII